MEISNFELLNTPLSEDFLRPAYQYTSMEAHSWEELRDTDMIIVGQLINACQSETSN